MSAIESLHSQTEDNAMVVDITKMATTKEKRKKAVSTTNACKLCEPLGASLVFRGVEQSMPIVHGSQGCATYIRRYIISHFNEPVDIASSNFSEAETVFGGAPSLVTALDNVIAKYSPKFIGVSSTCLTETIGDDMSAIVREYKKDRKDMLLPEIVTASTPSYAGTHIEGYHAAVKAIVEQMASGGPKLDKVNVFPGIVSAADLRHLKEIFAGFGLDYTLLPDYSETLDGSSKCEYENIPSGGTTIEAIREMGRAQGSVLFGLTQKSSQTGAGELKKRYDIPVHKLPLPIGIEQTDRLMRVLEQISGQPAPKFMEEERGRLVDAYIDGHKYIFGKRAAVYGEEDFVVSMAAFLTEIGVRPVICASGGESGRFAETIKKLLPEESEDIQVAEGVDFYEIGNMAKETGVDLVIGNSKGYRTARELGVPLVRVGFPIHDRIGGQRILSVGYRGTQNLFDTITNTIIARKQDSSPVGYTYM